MHHSIHFEDRMQRWPFRIAINFLLAAVVFLSAELGRLMGIPDQALELSIVWPATGFSLAAILLFGFKVWPGIFVGNFIYNFIHLYVDVSFFPPLFVGSIISFGSLAQALVAGFIIRKYSSPKYFKTIRDVAIFLIPGGILSCLIGSTVGVTTLYLYGGIPENLLLIDWLTFWIGDSMGVYIITPLIVVWALHSFNNAYNGRLGEAVLMALAYSVLWILNFVWTFPLAHFFIPLSLWTTYRFHMHGATLSIFLISLGSIIPTSLGIGSFIVFLRTEHFFILITLMMIIVAISLILAAVINEREIAWNLLKNDNVDLQQGVDRYVKKMQEIKKSLLINKKLASIGKISLGIAKSIHLPLKDLKKLIDTAAQRINSLKAPFLHHRHVFDKNALKTIEENMEDLERCMQDLSLIESQTDRILSLIHKQAKRTSENMHQIHSINPHTLLNKCLEKVMNEAITELQGFTCNVIKDFDRNAKMIMGFPEELEEAFSLFIHRAMKSMKEKADVLGISYNPQLTIRTISRADGIEIIFRDNGPGVPDHELEKFMRSFIGTDLSKEITEFELSLAHDTVVHVHGGELSAASEEGEYFQISITIPHYISVPS